MSEYYDRQGHPLTQKEWAAIFGTRQGQKRVAETTLPNGRWVSTVWLGLNHAFRDGPPLIFETMVFPNEGDMGNLDCDRYSTEAEAVEGHARMCEKWAVESPEADDAVDPHVADHLGTSTRVKGRITSCLLVTATESLNHLLRSSG